MTKHVSPQDHPSWPSQSENRLRFHRIWQSAKGDSLGELAADDRQLAKIMLEHDEYHHQFEIADLLADHKFNPETDVNPFIHVTIHSVIENQLATKEPIEAFQFYNEVRRRGADRHETVHLIMAIFLPLLFDVLKNERDFDEKFYTFLLRRLKDKKPEKIRDALEKDLARYFHEDTDDGPP
jgi:hypothetical protein